MRLDEGSNLELKGPLLNKADAKNLEEDVSDESDSHLAHIASCIQRVNSLDYESVVNELSKEEWRCNKKTLLFEYLLPKWTLLSVLGVVVGLIGFFSNVLVENIAGLKLMMTNNFLLKQRFLEAFLVYAASNLISNVGASVLCVFIAPSAIGSGIPELKSYLNGVDTPNVLGLKTLFVKVFGTILSASSSLFVGKEAPMVHIGACVAYFLGQGGSHKYGFNWRWFRHFNNDRDRRDLVTCGSAAGIAAAFRAPIGGVLFAHEEISTQWHINLLSRTFFTTAVVVVVERALVGYCRGDSHRRCGLFGEGGLIMYDVSSKIGLYRAVDFFAIVVVGVVAGGLGSFFNYLVCKTSGFYNTVVHKKGTCYKIGLVAALSLTTSAVSFGLPWLVHCTPCPVKQSNLCPSTGRHINNYNPCHCPNGHYNDLASLFLNTQDGTIRNLFRGDSSEFQATTLVVFFAVSYVLAIISHGLVIPGGLFIPVILSGASYGRLVSKLLGDDASLAPGLYAVIGAAACLGGTMRVTISACVILLELTGDLTMLPLVMLVLVVSNIVGDCINQGLYQQMVKLKGLPYLELHNEYLGNMEELTAGDACAPPVVLTEVERVGTLVEILRVTTHNGFPVVDQNMFRGVVLRRHLLVLLASRRFMTDRGQIGAEAAKQQVVEDVDGVIGIIRSNKKDTPIEELEITKEEENMYIDLYPITNHNSYTVFETMSLTKAATLFYELGLRHLCVVPTMPGGAAVVGILTRHDFMPDHIRSLQFQVKEKQTV